jgi:transposase
MTRKRRGFSDEYKAEVVKLVKEGEKGIAQVCRDLDLTQSAVRRWVAQSDAAAGHGASGALTRDEQEELRRLRREVQQLRMEREILKKATAFFAKESS